MSRWPRNSSNTSIQPKVLNQYLKAGLGRWALPIPEIVKSDPFWLKEDPHRTAYMTQIGDRPDLPDLRGVQPGHGAGRRRACHHDRGV